MSYFLLHHVTGEYLITAGKAFGKPINGSYQGRVLIPRGGGYLNHNQGL